MKSAIHSNSMTTLPGGTRMSMGVVPRAVRTPHSGYHYDGRKSRFFEGWYFKVIVSAFNS